MKAKIKPVKEISRWSNRSIAHLFARQLQNGNIYAEVSDPSPNDVMTLVVWLKRATSKQKALRDQNKDRIKEERLKSEQKANTFTDKERRNLFKSHV